MDTRCVTAAVRALKGAPASIILVLSVAPEGQTFQVQQLAMMTGYSEQGVSIGLRVLELLGLVQSRSQSSGWTLTTPIRQLW